MTAPPSRKRVKFIIDFSSKMEADNIFKDFPYCFHLGNKIYHHEKLTNFYCCDIGLGSIFITRETLMLRGEKWRLEEFYLV